LKTKPKKEKIIEIPKPGTKVRFKNGLTHGIIIGVLICPKDILYNMVWWNNGTRVEGYVNPIEVEITKGILGKVGFVGDSNE
jgi:hypothetical protein